MNPKPRLPVTLLFLAILACPSVAEASTPATLASSSSAQDPAAPQLPTQNSSRRSFSPAYTEIDNAYKGKDLDFDKARLQADRETAGKGPDAKPSTKVPPNPAIAFLPRFQALADKGDGDALAWVFKHAGEAVVNAAECLRVAQDALERLITKHADELCMQDALDASKQYWELFGAERLVALYERVSSASTLAETQARALLYKAWARTDRNRTTDPALWKEAEELERSIVGFAEADTALKGGAAGMPLSKAAVAAASSRGCSAACSARQAACSFTTGSSGEAIRRWAAGA